MLDLKDLECLIALARHRHFARAARDCGISQPAFSMRIRKLEDRLGTTIVKRGNRFQGLTAEGEAIVARARGILDDVRHLEQEHSSPGGEVSGALRLGVIPTALGYAGLLVIELRKHHPGITVRVDHGSSLEIQQGLEDGTLDAGLTYTEGVSQDLMQVTPLYNEEYVLLAPAALVANVEDEISWRDAAELPMCLLEPGMRNRRILDQVFDEVGAAPDVVAETSGFTSAIVMAVEGLAATVVPRVLLDSLGGFPNTRAIPIVDPIQTRSISLVASRRGPERAVVSALQDIAAARSIT